MRLICTSVKPAFVNQSMYSWGTSNYHQVRRPRFIADQGMPNMAWHCGTMSPVLQITWIRTEQSWNACCWLWYLQVRMSDNLHRAIGRYQKGKNWEKSCYPRARNWPSTQMKLQLYTFKAKPNTLCSWFCGYHSIGQVDLTSPKRWTSTIETSTLSTHHPRYIGWTLNMKLRCRNNLNKKCKSKQDTQKRARATRAYSFGGKEHPEVCHHARQPEGGVHRAYQAGHSTGLEDTVRLADSALRVRPVLDTARRMTATNKSQPDNYVLRFTSNTSLCCHCITHGIHSTLRLLLPYSALLRISLWRRRHLNWYGLCMLSEGYSSSVQVFPCSFKQCWGL